jgi:geranylgeranyl pyrophosphate synthase
MLSGNYIQEGREQATQLATLAQFSLSTLPASEANTELHKLAQQIIDRDH